MQTQSLEGTYEGDYLDGRFHGKGVYLHKDKRYVGEFINGLFHGNGILYVKGGSFIGYWNAGKLIDGNFVFDDGLQYKPLNQTQWDYCSSSDPRFYNEIRDGIQVGERLRDPTSHNYHDLLPPGCYDVVEGYYDPKRLMILSYTTGDEIRLPSKEEHEWIIANCRIGHGTKVI
eukprot:gene12693-17019_t